MKYTGRLITPEEFGDIVIRSTDNGEVLKLKDVADIQLGQDSYAYHGGMDGHPGVSCMVFQTAGSNATEVNQNIDKLLEEASKDLPKGVELTQIMSSNDFLFASIHEVVKTLIEAIILVILVVYVFLQDFRSTLIPLVGVIVSLIGTFAFMAVAGFSINLAHAVCARARHRYGGGRRHYCRRGGAGTLRRGIQVVLYGKYRCNERYQ